jgi:enoyl-CoA hydratase/carnithine racemase
MTDIESTRHVLVDSRDGIMHIRMNRPEKKNALTRAMYLTIAEALSRADADDAVRVVLLTGTDDCFTSGNDLADFRALPDGEKRPRNPILKAIPQAKKPIIAAVNGVAIGVGTTMLLHCDLVYAGTSARFQLPFVSLGLCPELGSSALLPMLMGHQRAADLLLLGEPFNADTAREIGIVNAVYSDDALLEMALRKARQLAAQPPESVRLTKALLKQGREQVVAAAIEEEVGHFNVRLKSPEAHEAFQAFTERRKPDFSNF